MSACKTCKTLRLLGNMNVRDLLLTNLLGSDHFPTCQLPVVPALNCCFSCCVLWRECNIEPVSRLSNWSIFVGRKGWAQIEIIWRHGIFKHTQAFLTSNEVWTWHNNNYRTLCIICNKQNAFWSWFCRWSSKPKPPSPRFRQGTNKQLRITCHEIQPKEPSQKLILPFPYDVWMVQKSNFTQLRYMKANRQQLGDSHTFLSTQDLLNHQRWKLWDVTKVIS